MKKNLTRKRKKPIRAETLEAWLALPPKERLFFGVFYREPLAMELGEWDRFDAYMQKHFRFQFYFSKFVYWLNRCWRRYITQSIYYLKCKFWYKYNLLRLGNDPTYKDPRWLLEHSIVRILEIFIEKEKAFEIIDWESNDMHTAAYHDLKQSYDFFKVILPQKQEKFNKLMSDCYGQTAWKEFMQNLKQPVPPEVAQKRKEIDRLEQEIEDQITEHLILVCKHRLFLWT